MSVGKAVAICATSSLTMFNVFLLVMLVWSAQVTRAQTFEKQLKASLTGQQELTSASAAVIQANDKRLHNGVTNPDGNEPSVHKAQLSDYSDYDYEEDNSSKEDEEDDEDYMREVKAIIGGVLGFWGGVGGLGTMFLVIVLSQRYCCKEDDGKDDGDG